MRQQTQKFGKTDLFQIPYGCGDAMSLRDYKAMAEQFEQKQMTLDEAEEKFWTMDLERENDHGRLPTYAIDNEISLFSSDYNTWNLNKFQGGSILSGKEMKGINTSYTNYGMYQTCFPMHVEDSNLASLNILHQGATKIWYGVPATMATKLEAISKDEISEESRCDFFLRHKTLLYSPKLLRENGVEFGKVSLYFYVVLAFPTRPIYASYSFYCHYCLLFICPGISKYGRYHSHDVQRLPPGFQHWIQLL